MIKFSEAHIIGTVISYLLGVFLVPLVIEISKKRGLVDLPDERKIHTGDKPRLGGIGIITGFVISAIVYVLTETNISFSTTLPIIIAGAIIFLHVHAKTVDEAKSSAIPFAIFAIISADFLLISRISDSNCLILLSIVSAYSGWLFISFLVLIETEFKVIFVKR